MLEIWRGEHGFLRWILLVQRRFIRPYTPRAPCVVFSMARGRCKSGALAAAANTKAVRLEAVSGRAIWGVSVAGARLADAPGALHDTRSIPQTLARQGV